MWQLFDNKILFVDDGSERFAWDPFVVDTWRFSGEIISIPCPDVGWPGYDAWVQSFSAHDELTIVRSAIQQAQRDPSYRVHIRGISLAESIECIKTYYREQGYEDALAKNYSLPDTVQVTVSVSLRHALWCEKDKRFLATQDKNGKPYGMISPPIRGSHDLRVIQQALRMNTILGLDVFPSDYEYIDQLVADEILPPFSVGQMIRFRWERYNV